MSSAHQHPIVGAMAAPRFTTSLGVPRLEGRRVSVEYTLAQPEQVSLAIFDVAGRRVAAVDETMEEQGSHHATLPTSGLAHGVYFLRMTAAGKTYVQRLPMARISRR